MAAHVLQYSLNICALMQQNISEILFDNNLTALYFLCYISLSSFQVKSDLCVSLGFFAPFIAFGYLHDIESSRKYHFNHLPDCNFQI